MGVYEDWYDGNLEALAALRVLAPQLHTLDYRIKALTREYDSIKAMIGAIVETLDGQKVEMIGVGTFAWNDGSPPKPVANADVVTSVIALLTKAGHTTFAEMLSDGVSMDNGRKRSLVYNREKKK
jgi:hypothetical protein